MEEELYAGLAIGGPMDGREVESRYPGSVLFVSKPTNKAWVYDYYAESTRFILRPVGYDAFWDGMSDQNKMNILQDTTFSGVDGTRELDREAASLAADSSNTEVQALPDESRVVV
jgi:hypothetical protein